MYCLVLFFGNFTSLIMSVCLTETAIERWRSLNEIELLVRDNDSRHHHHHCHHHNGDFRFHYHFFDVTPCLLIIRPTISMSVCPSVPTTMFLSLTETETLILNFEVASHFLWMWTALVLISFFVSHWSDFC